MEFTFFCDESGNSGSRFYYPAQPIYAEGGWIVPAETRDELRTEILRLEKESGYTPSTKGTALKGSPKGRAYMLRVIDACSQRAIPFISLVEKRYAICAKAVETYYDPVYNPAVSPHETWDPERRQERAQMLYGGPEELVAAFAEAFRTRDAKGVRAVGERWADYLDGAGKRVDAEELRRCLPDIEVNVAREFEAFAAPETLRGYDSLNMPILHQVFQTIEQNVPECEIVHDECASFEPVYKHVFELTKNADPAVMVMKDGRQHVYGFQNIKGLSFGDSEIEPLLRAADYLVAACVEFGRSAFERRPIDATIAKIAYPAIGGIIVWALSQQHGLKPMPKVGEIFASEDWVGRCNGEMLKFMQTA